MENISLAIEAIKARLPSMECRLDEPMKNHTSIRIGGSMRAMCLPKSAEDLSLLCNLLREFETKLLIMGNGTNLLVDDSKPLEMITIKTTGISDMRLSGETEITAGAGASLSRLAVFARMHELSGLECAHGIPGTLGGAVAINAGAYGMEMKDVVHSTSVFDCSGLICGIDGSINEREKAARVEPMSIDGASSQFGIYTVTGEEHGFSYRNSRFAHSNDIILSSVIRLKRSDKESISAQMDELAVRRKESQPLELPSAGSTFKRPKDGYAAALTEQAGLKGFAIGGAQISSKHSGFIVNNGTATFADVMAIIDHVKDAVHKQFGIELELEYKIVKG